MIQMSMGNSGEVMNIAIMTGFSSKKCFIGKRQLTCNRIDYLASEGFGVHEIACRLAPPSINPKKERSLFAAVFTDRFYGATLECFDAELDFFFGGRLLMDERVTTIIVAREKKRSGFATEIAVNALLIDVEITGSVVFPFVCFVSHKSTQRLSFSLSSSAQMISVLCLRLGLVITNGRHTLLSDANRPHLYAQ